jgi:hypothetical protein
MADSSSRTGASLIHTAGGASRASKCSSHTNKSFIGAGKSSSRTVFCQKHAKTGKNRLFSLFRHANWSKNDSFPTIAGRARHSVRAAYTRTLAYDGSLATLAAGRGLPALPFRVFRLFRGSTHN